MLDHDTASRNSRTAMAASDSHPFLRPGRMNTYTAYSIGFFATWAVFLAVVAPMASGRTREYIFSIFGGCVIGWTSATVARVVYPPPKKRRTAGPTSFFQGFRET
jgi:hypothetical protein